MTKIKLMLLLCLLGMMVIACSDDDFGVNGAGLRQEELPVVDTAKVDTNKVDTVRVDTTVVDTVDHNIEPEVDPTRWASVLGTNCKNVNGIIHALIWGKASSGDSIKAELVYPLDVEISAPERVVGKRDSTIYYTSESEKGYDAWTPVNGSDSIETTRITRYFLTRENMAGELYRIRVSYTLRKGYIIVNGHQQAFPMPTVTSQYAGHAREWVKNFELNDSTFLREVLTSKIKFSAQYVESVLTSTTNIDRDGKPIEAEVDPTPTPDPTTADADAYVKGLTSFLGGNKFFNKQTNHWSDGLLYEGSDYYLIVVRNYTVNSEGKESFLSAQTVTVKKSVIGKDTYDAVLCDPNTGEILPGFITVRGTSWTIEGPVSKPDNCYEQHTQQEANNSGIKNQPTDNNAHCSAKITVNNTKTTVNGYTFFTTSVKTSAHSYVVKVADENLKK